jgi:hypothetical protein
MKMGKPTNNAGHPERSGVRAANAAQDDARWGRVFSAWAILVGVFFLSLPVPVRAEQPSATAILSETATEVGQPVQLQVKISGAKSDDAPEIKVDGLDIAYHGASSQSSFNFVNGKLSSSSSVVHNYSITPLRGGEFTIPALRISVGGKTVATQPVTLSVGGAAAGAQGRASPSGGGNALAFGEVVLPKQTAYVGEVVPVELRFYVDSRVRWQTQQQPKLEGDGFSAQKFTEPQQSTVARDGRNYDLVIYKTTVTPAKAGKLALGPVELQALAQMPRQKKQRRARGPFDDFLGGDPFEDLLGSMPVTQQIGIRGVAAELDVKPLPQGAPKSFTGAVGDFKMSASADPASVKLGDPVTLKVAVSGRGNFDRVGAPLVADEKGWRSYPPTQEFKQDDDVGMSGSKTFSFAMIPSEKKSALPAVEFTFFDPAQEKYVTLNGGRIAVAVTGEEAAPPMVAQPGSASTPPTATPAAQPAPAAADIHYIRTDEGKRGLTFEPLYRRRGFWLAQLVPLAGLLAFAGLQILRIRAGDVRARELAELRREKARLMESLQRRDVAARDFYDAAVRCAQIDAAARLGRNAASIDANEAASLPGIDDGTAKGVRAIFAARDELLYAGSGATGAGVDAETRERVQGTLRKLEAGHA